ncbi:MAG: preprotein translocase subunit SecA [Candidatus Kerfeldbacteria bacterium]|nr:preprotein translocase subunit SecA [Candidatus Kerfeldbacteria bacterium]
MYPFLKTLFGDQNKRNVAALQKKVERINSLEVETQKLSDEELRAKTTSFKEKLSAGTAIETIVPEAFAVVREAARRTLGQRHFDVQLIGGLALFEGKIAEMKTGEGKTLTATTAAYARALEGKGVHIVTVNDYLARRDADWMGQIYSFLGLTVGCIQHDAAFVYEAEMQKADPRSSEGVGSEALITADMSHLRAVSRKEAYAADIVFGTNNEFGFDYLRDNMVAEKEQRSQRGLHFAIIDEVDSILIDEARTPLIISAPAEEATSQYYMYAQLVATLTQEADYTVDEKMRAVSLTDEGIAKVEKALKIDNLYIETGLRTVHHIEQALKARVLFLKDKDYVVREGEVVIIDEFTGRMMQGRRYSEGLHQAIEAKEGVAIKQESRTLATITLQNLFRMYAKISGMTGTAATEAEEFEKIYNLEVVSVPSHRGIARIDAADRVYKDTVSKYRAVMNKVKELHDNGQPVLIGTISIEHNEMLSQLLTANGIAHKVLNAKQHEKEAEIIAQAGRLGAVTLATNMAGRGVDILLGGNPVDINEARKVRELGGLAVIGTERHESRRIDNQLRGRAGRQGDPGYSQFFVSLDDDLMRIFGSERMKNMMNRLGVPDDVPIENKIVSRSIETAQKKVEARHFDIRKHVVEYDDVMNKHREVIYRKRNQLLDSTPEEVHALIVEMIGDEVERVVTNYAALDSDTPWNIDGLSEALAHITHLSQDMIKIEAQSLITQEEGKLNAAELRTSVINRLIEIATAEFEDQAKHLETPELRNVVERVYALRPIDILWRDHLDHMNYLRDAIGLRGYGQKDPLVEYKHESYQAFQNLLAMIQERTVQAVFTIRTARVMVQAAQAEQQPAQKMQYTAPEKEMKKEGEQKPAESTKKNDSGEKIGRNDPCYCGSGKKFKKCHGQG